MTKLWHDDCRKPPDESWVWARTNDDARACFKAYTITEVSLDHDMGCHDVPVDESVQGEEPNIYLRGDDEDNGYELVKWMVETGNVPETITIHSWNPDGARRMAEYLLHRYVGDKSVSLRIQPYEVKK